MNELQLDDLNEVFRERSMAAWTVGDVHGAAVWEEAMETLRKARLQALRAKRPLPNHEREPND